MSWNTSNDYLDSVDINVPTKQCADIARMEKTIQEDAVTVWKLNNSIKYFTSMISYLLDQQQWCNPWTCGTCNNINRVNRDEIAQKIQETEVLREASEQDLVEKNKCIEECKTFIQDAYTDALTRLPNYAKLLSLLHAILIHEGKNSKNLAIGVMDIDNFKQANEVYGHDGWDKILSHFADMIHYTIRELQEKAEKEKKIKHKKNGIQPFRKSWDEFVSLGNNEKMTSEFFKFLQYILSQKPISVLNIKTNKHEDYYIKFSGWISNLSVVPHEILEASIDVLINLKIMEEANLQKNAVIQKDARNISDIKKMVIELEQWLINLTLKIPDMYCGYAEWKGKGCFFDTSKISKNSHDLGDLKGTFTTYLSEFQKIIDKARMFTETQSAMISSQ